MKKTTYSIQMNLQEAKRLLWLRIVVIVVSGIMMLLLIPAATIFLPQELGRPYPLLVILLILITIVGGISVFWKDGLRDKTWTALKTLYVLLTVITLFALFNSMTPCKGFDCLANGTWLMVLVLVAIMMAMLIPVDAIMMAINTV